MAEVRTGLFGELGFPELTRDGLLKQRAATEQEKFRKLVSEDAASLPAGEQGIFRAFANLGRAVGGKPEAELTGKEKQQFAIMERSNVLMQELRKTSKFKLAKPQDRALMAQDSMAQAAMDNGDIDTFSQIALKTATQRQAFNRAEADLEKVGVDTSGVESRTKATEQETGILAHRFKIAKQGGQGVFALPGPEGFDFDTDPELVPGKLGEDGILRTTDGREFNSFIDADTFAKFQKNATDAKKPPGGAGKKPIDRFLTNISSKERSSARALKKDIASQTAIIGTVGQVIGDALKRGESPEAVIGSAGGFIRLADNVFRAAKGTVAGFKPNFKNEADGTIISGIDGAVEIFGNEIGLPEGLEENAPEAAKYRSAIMQAVYVDARLAEPGARQLSDADIKNAMDRLGVNSGNPRAIFGTLLQNFDRRAEGTKTSIQTIRDVGEASGITADLAERTIFGEGTGAMIDSNTQLLRDLQSDLERDLDLGPQAVEARENPVGEPAPQTAADVQAIIDAL
jgi:hypothetical protein